MYNFWNMQIPRIVLVIYFMVMLTLAKNLRSVYCDFDGFCWRLCLCLLRSIIGFIKDVSCKDYV